MSKLNCEKGDVAIIIRSQAGNEGKLVTCLELEYHTVEYKDGRVELNVPCWRIDRKLPQWDGSHGDLYIDKWLRPLRDTDGEDEMIRIAGKPKELADCAT